MTKPLPKYVLHSYVFFYVNPSFAKEGNKKYLELNHMVLWVSKRLLQYIDLRPCPQQDLILQLLDWESTTEPNTQLRVIVEGKPISNLSKK